MDKVVKGGKFTVESDPRKPAKGGMGVVGVIYPTGFRSGAPLARVIHDTSLHPSIRVEFVKSSEGFTAAEARALARLLRRAASAADPKPPVKPKVRTPLEQGGRGRVGQIA